MFLSPSDIRPAKFWTFCNLSILLLLVCCVVGLNGGGLFPLLCSLPKPASNPDVSLSMKIFAPRKAGRRKRLSSFSFLWLAYVANASARVSQAVPKLEPEEKKAFALSLCTFSRNNSSGHAWYAGYPDVVITGKLQ